MEALETREKTQKTSATLDQWTPRRGLVRLKGPRARMTLRNEEMCQTNEISITYERKLTEQKQKDSPKPQLIHECRDASLENLG